MTVRDLIEELSRFDPNTPIVMASDPEGNAFRGYCEASLQRWLPPDQGPAQEVYDAAAIAMEDGEFLIECIVLWPL